MFPAFRLSLSTHVICVYIYIIIYIYIHMYRRTHVHVCCNSRSGLSRCARPRTLRRSIRTAPPLESCRSLRWIRKEGARAVVSWRQAQWGLLCGPCSELSQRGGCKAGGMSAAMQGWPMLPACSLKAHVAALQCMVPGYIGI